MDMGAGLARVEPYCQGRAEEMGTSHVVPGQYLRALPIALDVSVLY